MVTLVTCKNAEDSIKNEGARELTTFLPLKVYGDFLDAQEQLSPQSVVGSGRMSNSSMIFWFSFVPARIRKTRSKLKAQEC